MWNGLEQLARAAPDPTQPAPDLGAPAVIGLVLAGLVALWLLAWPWLWWRDRRPRQAHRCRRCWYDLRGHGPDQIAHCPECGDDLLRRGIWRPGRPRRGSLLTAMLIWTGLAATAAIPIAVAFYHHTVRVSTFQAPSVSAEIPDGRAFASAWLGISGSALAWPWQEAPELTVQTLTLTIENAQGRANYLDIGLDPATLKVRFTDIPNPEHGAPAEYASEPQKLTPNHLYELIYDEFYVPGNQVKTVHQDAAALAGAAQRLARLRRYTSEPDPAQQAHLDGAAAELERFSHIRAWPEAQLTEEPAPAWVFLLALAPGAVVWAAGCYPVYRLWERGNTAAWPA
jgi:hypothetical protein